MRLFFTACQFLTIIPLPVRLNYQAGDMGRSMRWFPLVGLTIGCLLAGLRYCLLFIFPEQLVAVMLVAVLALISGGLHLDGLADVFDGFGARGGRERFLAVMKDSSTGAIGAAALFLGLLLKYQALLLLPAGAQYGGIILFPAAARFSQVLMTVGSRRARDDGLGAGFIATAGKVELFIAAVTVLVAAFALLGIIGILCCLVIALFAYGSKSYFHGRLGGVTGDIIGCTSELAEILALVTIIGLAQTLEDIL